MFMDVWMMQIGCKKKSETKQSCKFYVVPTEYLYIVYVWGARYLSKANSSACLWGGKMLTVFVILNLKIKSWTNWTIGLLSPPNEQ